MAGVAAFTLVGLAMITLFGGAFLPELREGHFIVHMSAVPGTSLGESLRIGRRVSRALLNLPYVSSVAQRAGRAEKADDVWGTHYSEIEVDLKALNGRQAEKAREEIRHTLDRFPGVNFAVKTFLTERIEETFSGYTAPVAVNIFGNDLDVLDRKAQEVACVLSNIPGALDIQVQSPPGMPRLAIRLRKKDLLHWGLTSVDVLDAVRTAYQGDIVGQIYDGNRIFDVSVILSPEDRRSVAGVGTLPLRNAEGGYVPLSRVADIYETSGRYAILHQGARRVQTVTCNVARVDLNTFVHEAEKAVFSSVHFPAGTYVEFSGTGQAQARSRQDLLIHSLLAASGILMLLSVVMQGVRNLFLVLVNLPFAMVGGVLAVFFFWRLALDRLAGGLCHPVRDYAA